MHTLHAAKAKDKDAIGFLLHLGFTNPEVTESGANRIALTYESMDEAKLKRELGNPLPNLSPEFYNFGVSGKVIVNQKTKQVVLLNVKSNSMNPNPIRTHVPEGTSQEPAQPRILPKLITPVNQPKITVDDPTKVNLPSSKDNDDDKVPHVQLTEQLEHDYIYARVNGSMGAQVNFINKLYTYLNNFKFKDQLKKPTLGLLKNVSAGKLSLRGVWRPAQRRIDLSPRLFNAHIAFFTEILLHEMCHQATTEISGETHYNQATAHGPTWQHWMIKVGLNPRRFDPNDNSTYMTPSERQEHENKKNETENLRQDLVKYDLHRYVKPIPATLVNDGQAHNGVLFRVSSGYRFMSDAQLLEGGGRAYTLKTDKNIYEYDGDQPQSYSNPAWKHALKKWGVSI